MNSLVNKENKMMTAYIVKVNGRRVDEVVFLKDKSLKEVKAALVKEGYDPKTLSVKRTYM